MGNSSTSELQSRFYSKYHKLQTTQDDRYGSLDLFKSNSENELVILKQTWCSTKKEAITFMADLKCAKSIDCPNIAKIIHDSMESEHQKMADFRKFYIASEFPPKTLDEDIQRNMRLPASERTVVPCF